MIMKTEDTTTPGWVALPTPCVSAFGAHAIKAADSGDDEAGEKRLGQAFDNVS